MLTNSYIDKNFNKFQIDITTTTILAIEVTNEEII